MTDTPDYNDLAYSMSGVRRRNPFDARRQYGYGMLKQSADTSPIDHPMQGAARLAQALLGGWMTGKADSDEKESVQKQQTALAAAMTEPDPQKRIQMISASNPDLGARLSGQLAIEQAKQGQQQAGLQAGAGNFGSIYGGGPQGPQTASAPPLPQGEPAPGGFNNNVGNIRASNAPWQDKGAPQNGFETFNTPQAGVNAAFGNLNAYVRANPTMSVADAIKKWAPPTENNTDLYIRQVAEGTGINPGMPLGEVLKDPAVAAQLLDAITRKEKGGLPQGVNADTFMAATTPRQPPTGQPAPLQPQIEQGSSDQPPGMPPAPNPQVVGGPTVQAAPPVPNTPRPQPSPQQLQQYQQRIASGEFGTDPKVAIPAARAALEAELDRNWGVQRDRDKMEYEQKLGDYKDARGQPQHNIQNESQLRQQFDNLQSVKDYRKAHTVFESAVKAANTNSAAADLNLVYAFATMMDPGSVVREGEMGMVKATQNASDQVKSMVAAVSGGQRISPEARQALVDQMHVRYQAYKSSHDELAQAFGGIADRSQMNRSNVAVPLPEVGWKRSEKNERGGAPGRVVYGLDGKPVK